METIALPGLINIDFADVRSTLEGRGRLAYIHSAEFTGPTKAQEVVQAALGNPLYDYGIDGADRILFNVTGDRGLKMREVALVSGAISTRNPKARIIFGVSCNAKSKDSIKVTLLAVGCDECGETKKDVAGHEKKRKQTVFLKRKKRAIQKVASGQEGKELGASLGPHGEQGKTEQGPEDLLEAERKRRNAMEVKKAVEQEMKELEQKEREWDIPSFMRNK